MAFNKNQAAKITTVLLCLVLTATFMICGMTGVIHAAHRCSDNNCHICDLLHSTANILKQLALALPLAGMAALACGPLLYGGYVFYVCIARAASLVGMKVRMDY